MKVSDIWKRVTKPESGWDFAGFASEIGWNKTDNGIEIVFQGSTDWKDWILNFMGWKRRLKTPQGTVWVCAGDLLKFRALYSKVNALIRKHTPEHVTYSGYSAGGAQAQLFKIAHSYNWPSISCNCITLGTKPVIGRIGRRKQKWFDSTSHFIMKGDIVPRLPCGILYGVLIHLECPEAKGFVENHIAYRKEEIIYGN